MRSSTSFFFVALHCLSSVSALYDPFNDFCKLIDQSSALKNGVLYIDGGRQIFTQKSSNGTDIGPRVSGLNEYLFTLDMTKAWDANSTLPIKAIQKSSGVPYLVRGALFEYPNDQKKLMTFGGTVSMDNTSFVGWQAPQDESKSVYTYDIAANSWTSTDLTTQGLVRPASGASALVPDKGLAFYFNGQQDWGSSQQAKVINDTTKFLDGMIVLDINTQKARNLSTSAVSSRPRVRGKMVHVPLPNTDGILVLLGGGEKNSNDLTHEWKGELVSFENIDILDVRSIANGSNGTWLTQATVGAPPAPRLDPCIIVQTAADNSSYNIYMFGGRDGVWTYYDELWVLTMPTFRWIQVSRAKSPRYGMTCHAFGRQMVTIGGSDNSNLTSRCDPSPYGINVFDTVDMTWSSKFDPNAGKYQVPSQITKFVGGSSTGGASANSPPNGWTDDRLRMLFNAQGSSKATHKSDSSTKQSNAGVIAGGVIGGVAGLAVIALFAFLCVRRRKHQQKEEEKRESMRKSHVYSPVSQSPAESSIVAEDKKLAHVSTGEQLDSSEVFEMHATGNDAHLAEAPPRSPTELP